MSTKAQKVKQSVNDKWSVKQGYKSNAHRLAHPYRDALSDYIGENDHALNALINIQAEAQTKRSALSGKCATIEDWNFESAFISQEQTRIWLSYVRVSGHKAPKAVIEQAEIAVTYAENHVKRCAEKVGV